MAKDTLEVLRPFRWNGKQLKRGQRITETRDDPTTRRKITGLIARRWLGVCEPEQARAATRKGA